MRRLFKTTLISLFILRLASPVFALDLPSPVGFVNDFAKILSSQFIASLESELTDFSQTTGNEISVVTVNDFQETTIEDYAVHLFEAWAIGQKHKDNGLLILVAPAQRQIRIEVGYGLESIITDGRAGEIIREEITPAFKNEAYEQGITNGISKIKTYLTLDPASLPASDYSPDNASLGVPSPFVIIFIILIYLSSFWGRSQRIWPGALVGGLLGLLLGFFKTGSFILGNTILFFFLGLFLDWLFSRNYKRLRQNNRPTDWFHSRGGFGGLGGLGGGGRSGGFGGFGGGRSGGGGASGRW